MLKDVYSILKLEDKENVFRLTKPTRPTKSFTINQFNIPENRQKAKVKEYLSKALAFIEMKKQWRFSNGFTVMPISCKSKRLLSMFVKSQPRVSMFIDYLITIGLLAEYDETYQFNAYYSKDNKCKRYVYSYDTEIHIIEYCNKNNINKYKIKNNIYNNSIKLQNLDSFDKTAVVFSSKLNLLKPDNWTCNQFEEYLTACLYENYPQLEHYQNMADLINDVYYDNDCDRQIQFVPNFTWQKGNKIIRKIGIRATNSLVSAKKEEDYDKLTRQEVLDKYDLKYDFDVKSSVPRITYLLNNGTWLDNSVDFYKRMFENFCHICPSEKLEWNEETREMFKSFHMRGYFDTYAKVSGHIKRELGKKIEYKRSDWSELDYVMKSYKQSIEMTVGQEYDSEVFFHESCIYLDVLFELLKRNYNVWQCYDCWYTDKEVEDIQEIICNKALSYYSLYVYKDNKDNDNDNNNSSNDNTNKDNIYNNSIKLQNDDVDSLVDLALLE